jgi:hypothetical protein
MPLRNKAVIHLAHDVGYLRCRRLLEWDALLVWIFGIAHYYPRDLAMFLQEVEEAHSARDLACASMRKWHVIYQWDGGG